MEKEKKQTKNYTVISIIGVLVLGILMSSWYYVPQGKVGVLFNKVNGFDYDEKPQGLGLKIPFIEAVRKMEFRTQTLSLLGKQALTPKDKAGINFNQELVIRFKLDPSQAAEFAELKGYNMETVIYTATRGAARNVLGRYAQEDVPKNRSAIAEEIRIELQKRLNSETIGKLKDNYFIVEAVDVRNTQFNAEIEKAINNKQIQKQVAEQREYELQARGLEKQMAIVKAEGEGEAIRLVAKGKADGIRLINNAYQSMPPQYVQVKYAEAIRPTDKIYLGFDSLSGGSNLGVLNYNQLMGLQQANVVNITG